MRIILGLALLMVAGCGGNGTVETTSVIGTTVTVHVGSNGTNTFSPNTVTIHPNDSVLWTWDSGPHTVTSGVANAIDGIFCSVPPNLTPNLKVCALNAYPQSAGMNYLRTFPNVGSFPYFDMVHGATGTVIVE